MKVVKLQYGEEIEPLIRATLLSLHHLIKTNPIGFYELTMVCRDSDHEIWGDQATKLQSLGLMQRDGHVHESIRNIVLSSVRGDGLDMTLTNPL